MDLDDLTPAGGGSLRRPVAGPHGQVVATFSAPQTPDPAELWEPFTRMNDRTRNASQGNPFGRPGHSIEYEPVDRAERNSEHTVQTVAGHAAIIRAAIRPGSIAG
jgi:hypothetical protein